MLNRKESLYPKEWVKMGDEDLDADEALLAADKTTCKASKPVLIYGGKEDQRRGEFDIFRYRTIL